VGRASSRVQLVEEVFTRVGLVPFQDDPVSVYRSLDIAVHASTRPEPFGLTVAEAMSCGRAVVVSAELFRDGEDALGHPPGDVPALAGVLARLLTDAALRRRLGEAARRTAVSRFGFGQLGPKSPPLTATSAPPPDRRVRQSGAFVLHFAGVGYTVRPSLPSPGSP